MPLTSVEERLFAGLASQAGLVLRGARLRAELEGRLVELSARAEELRASRQRLVDAQDAERRRLERDIHDGAQQHLVALAVNLRLAETLAHRSPERADVLLAAQEQAAGDAIETLLQLSRGIYPRLLADQGLAAALRLAAGAGPVPVEVTTETSRATPPTVEAAAYFCCLEAVQNAAKHSGASTIRVLLRGTPGVLECVVEDDGAGFDARPTPRAAGWPTCATASSRSTAPSVVRTPARRRTGPGAHPDGGRLMRARVAWLLAGLTLVLVVADAVVTAQYGTLFSEAVVAVHGFPFVDGAVLGCAVMGALIISRSERHPIGWLLSVVGFTSALSLVCEAYSIWVTNEGGPGSRSLGGVTGWLATLFGGQLAIAGIALMFLLAPDGKLLSRRWRYAAALALLGPLLCIAGLVLSNPARYDISADAAATGPLQSLLFSIGFLLISVGLLASLVSMLVRWRRSQGEQRQQVRLIAASAALISIGLLALFVVQIFNGGRQSWAASLPLFTSYLLLPVLFAVAVLRYRLYDIEVIINRTVVLAVGSAFAGIGYTTLVVAVGKRVDQQTSGFWLSLLATAVVALAFQPLRRQVTRLANRLAFGSRAQPYEALSHFSRRLAETPTADAVLPAVAEAAGRAVSARSATATLGVSAAVPSAVWGDAAAEGTASHVVPVQYGGAVLGSIEVHVPRGRPVSDSDERLLTALADQTAVAFRNTALESELAEHVAELAAPPASWRARGQGSWRRTTPLAERSRPPSSAR